MGWKTGLIAGVLVCVFAVVNVSAAPIEIPLSLKQGEKPSSSITIVGESDSLADRDLDALDGCVDEATFLSVKAYSDFSIDPVSGNLYALLGEARDMTLKASFSGTSVEYNLENSLLVGGGITFELGAENDTYLDHFIDISYRQIVSGDYDSVSVGGGNSSGTALQPALRPQYYEIQAAVGVCKKIKQFLPYAGLKLSEVEATSSVTVSGTQYRLNANSDKALGFFIGCAIMPIDQIGIDVQARYGEEKGITLRGSYSF